MNYDVDAQMILIHWLKTIKRQHKVIYIMAMVKNTKDLKWGGPSKLLLSNGNVLYTTDKDEKKTSHNFVGLEGNTISTMRYNISGLEYYVYNKDVKVVQQILLIIIKMLK